MANQNCCFMIIAGANADYLKSTDTKKGLMRSSFLKKKTEHNYFPELDLIYSKWL